MSDANAARWLWCRENAFTAYKVYFKSSQTFSKEAQPVAPLICKYARLKGPSFIDILPKFHDIWVYRTGVIAPKVTVCFCCRSENEYRTKS